MRAVYFPGPGRVTAGHRPDPSARPGEAIVAVRASGLCHTDIEVMRGNYGDGAFPVVPGHEYAGEVVAIGPEVDGLRVGDRVVIDPNLECGACRACLRGWAHLCERLGAYGVTVDGGLAEFCAVRADRLHAAGELGFTAATLAEPMGCVLNGLSPLEGRILDRALLFGAGPMGVLIGLALRNRGVVDVFIVEPDPARRALAATFGLSALAPDAKELAALRRGCDLVVDATGAPDVAEALIGYAANGGAVLLFGVCPQDARIAISPFAVFRRQLSLSGAHSLNHNIPAALTTLKAIGPQVERLVTHRLDPEAMAQVIAGARPEGAMKVQLAF
ncbi:MAG: alcohol dehydrogenase catalytic domain-containing protein [Rubrimonas sp.]